MPLTTGDLAYDEARYLSGYNYPLKTLFLGGGAVAEATSSNIQRVRKCTMSVYWCFVLSGAAFLAPKPFDIIGGLIALYIIGHLACSLFTLMLTVIMEPFKQKSEERSVIYWSWWPCWTFAFCCIAALTGGYCGRWIWTHGFQQYQEVATLKSYKDINPSIVSGQQIQDSGAVDFTNSTGIDMSKGGCFMNGGHTYCIAPIVDGGQVVDDVGGSPRFGSYDYFAVGVDCCTCPNTDFRCGAARNPFAQGGIRSTDLESRPFYRLAVDAWASSYRKTVKHPLFFEWVETPVLYWRRLWRRTLWNIFVATLLPIPIIYCIAVCISRLHQALVVYNIGSPVGTPPPPAGLEGLWKKFLPDMLKRYEDEQAQFQAYGATAEEDAMNAALHPH